MLETEGVAEVEPAELDLEGEEPELLVLEVVVVEKLHEVDSSSTMSDAHICHAFSISISTDRA